jgi:uncharacterized protein YndB with AHSA1/START domain
MMSTFTPNPDLDLVLERTIPVSPERVWAAWTQPELMVQWFTPAPWKTVSCDVELRPGGRFYITMESPEGEQFPNNGCILQAIPNRLLVWTSVMGEGFRPVVPSNGAGDLPFTATVSLESVANGRTRYTASVIHADVEGRTRHAEMGFHEGWGAALDQLVSLMS